MIPIKVIISKLVNINHGNQILYQYQQTSIISINIIISTSTSISNSNQCLEKTSTNIDHLNEDNKTRSHY